MATTTRPSAPTTGGSIVVPHRCKLSKAFYPTPDALIALATDLIALADEVRCLREQVAA